MVCFPVLDSIHREMVCADAVTYVGVASEAVAR